MRFGKMSRALRALMAQPVIINCKADAAGQRGRAFRGVITAELGWVVEMRNAELLEAGERPKAVDGAVLIPRSDIAFIQVP